MRLTNLSGFLPRALIACMFFERTEIECTSTTQKSSLCSSDPFALVDSLPFHYSELHQACDGLKYRDDNRVSKLLVRLSIRHRNTEVGLTRPVITHKAGAFPRGQATWTTLLIQRIKQVSVRVEATIYQYLRAILVVTGR